MCPLRRERFVHLSRKRLFENDQMRSNEEREKEGPISITRTRVCGEGKTDALEEDEEKRRGKAKKNREERRGRKGRIRKVLRKLSLETLIRNMSKFCTRLCFATLCVALPAQRRDVHEGHAFCHMHVSRENAS